MRDFCDNSSWGEQFVKATVVPWIRIPWIVNVDEKGKGGALRLGIVSEYSANAGEIFAAESEISSPNGDVRHILALSSRPQSRRRSRGEVD